jgi:prophage DNA circulation protein
MTANRSRTMFAFHDSVTTDVGRIRKLSVHRRKRTSTWITQLRVANIDPGITPSATSATATLTVGSSAFAGDLACTPNRKATVTTCVR